MCGHRPHRREQSVERERAEDLAAPEPGHRASDADREEVVTVLRAAGADGLLEPEELAERTGAALSARTAGELVALTADLPPDHRRAGGRERRRREHAGRARAELRGHVRAYAGVMVLLVGIWLVAALSGGAWYPWPVWPALGWGVGVVSHALGARRELPRYSPSSLA